MFGKWGAVHLSALGTFKTRVIEEKKKQGVAAAMESRGVDIYIVALLF